MWRLAVILICARAWAASCPGLVKLNLGVEKAESIATGTFSPPTGAPLTGLPSFCRVTLTAKPSPDSAIGIEVWLPETNWNGRLQGTGNGGFAGHISYGALAAGLKLGYAVANTDMGMSTPAHADAGIFVDRPERWADWGYRATHVMTVAAKQLVKAYYNQPLQHSYFTGCSTGGEQALMEAQRYPDDYDGIVGGAPAHNRTGVHMSILWNFAVTERDAASYLPAAKLPLLSAAAVNSCDARDGVKDGIIADPTACRFDPAALQCHGADAADCLTAAQVNTVRQLYAGPGEKIYPGLPVGSEFGWDHLGPAPALAVEPPFAPIFKWVFGRAWNWRSFDFSRSPARFERKLAPLLNATNTDLHAFESRGGKLILYHGWADWLVVPGETVRYYNALPSHDSVRLFMVPGMAHCGGGPGADQFDALGAVARWVEQSTPPANVIATKSVKGKAVFRRLLCPYPQVAVYHQGGEPGDEHSYSCSRP